MPISATIIHAIRKQSQLHGNTFLVATELAHRLNPQGYGQVAYQLLAYKAHCSRRTAIRQIETLITQHRLFRKTVIRTKTGYAWNLYQYIGPRLSTAFPPATTHGDSVSPILPTPEKNLSLREEIATLEKGLRLFATPGTMHWEATSAKIVRLEGLLL